MSQAMHRRLLRICFESVGKCPLDESGKHPVNEQDEETPDGLIRELRSVIPGHRERSNDGRAKTKMAGKNPGHFNLVRVVRYAWLATVLPSAACAAARRAIGTR